MQSLIHEPINAPSPGAGCRQSNVAYFCDNGVLPQFPALLCASPISNFESRISFLLCVPTFSGMAPIIGVRPRFPVFLLPIRSDGFLPEFLNQVPKPEVFILHKGTQSIGQAVGKIECLDQHLDVGQVPQGAVFRGKA